MPTQPEGEHNKSRRRFFALYFHGDGAGQLPASLWQSTAALHTDKVHTMHKALRWARVHGDGGILIDSDSLRDRGVKLLRSLRTNGFAGPVSLIGTDPEQLRELTSGLAATHIYQAPADAEALSNHLANSIAAHRALLALRKGTAKLPAPAGTGGIPLVAAASRPGTRVPAARKRNRAFAALLAAAAAAGLALAVTGGLKRPLPANAPSPPPASGTAKPSQAAGATDLPRTLEATMDAEPGDTSLVVVDGEGKQLYSRADGVARTPASTLKLLTAAAAFQDLGAAFRFHTKLSAKAPPHNGILSDDLILSGDGDPTLQSADLRAGVAELRRRGVRRIDGGVVVETSPFEGPEQNPHWAKEDLSAPYGAGSAALSLDGNRASGVPVHDIPHFAGSRLEALLRANGIAVARPAQTRVHVASPNWVAWTHASQPLAEIVKDMLVDSDNLRAEQLLRGMGVHRYGRGSLAGGVAAESAILQRWRLPSSNLRIVDGSGLAESNRASASMIAAVLTREQRSPLGPVYYRSLPLLGSDGTTAGRILNAARGRVRAKDGHLHDANALAGYVDTRRHGRIAFAFIGNRADISHARFENLENRVVDLLASY